MEELLDMEGIKMFYMRTLWFHDNNDDPSIIYSELDQNRYEVRKIEFFKSGNHLYASQEKETESCLLGELPIPKIEEINKDKQFWAVEISKGEFDNAWEKVIHSKSWPK